VRLDVERFLAAHLNFSGRGFDVVLFWDTADYLPEELLVPVLERIHAVMVPEGQMLALFHPPAGVSASGAAKTGFHRYHLTGTNTVDVQRAGEYPMLTNYTNRQIERLLESFKGFHFSWQGQHARGCGYALGGWPSCEACSRISCRRLWRNFEFKRNDAAPPPWG